LRDQPPELLMAQDHSPFDWAHDRPFDPSILR